MRQINVSVEKDVKPGTLWVWVVGWSVIAPFGIVLAKLGIWFVGDDLIEFTGGVVRAVVNGIYGGA